MKKIIIIAMSAIAFSLAISACTKKVEVENNGTAANAAAEVQPEKATAEAAKIQGDEPVPAAIAQKDEELTRTTSPKGLTLTLSNLPSENLELVGVTGTVNGPYSNRMMYNALVYIQVERLEKAKEGEAGIEAAIRDIHADMNLRDFKIEKTDVAKNISEPVYKVTYTTGQNEDTSTNRDYYIVGDKFDFRLHTSCGVDFVDDYNELIDKLASGIHLQYNESEG